MENANLKNQDDERQMTSMLLKLYLNVALCAQELGQSARTISFARKVLYQISSLASDVPFPFHCTYIVHVQGVSMVCTDLEIGFRFQPC